MNLEDKKALNCKHPQMLTVKEEEVHSNGKMYFREILFCPVCGFKAKSSKKIDKYPRDFKVHMPHPGGKDIYR